MEKYFVAAFFERPNEDKDIIILEKFDPSDAMKKNKLINIIGDKTKSDAERVIAEAEYHTMRGERNGYYACGPYEIGEILESVPVDAELIPDFKEIEE